MRCIIVLCLVLAAGCGNSRLSDGMRLIPGGTFEMGSNDASFSFEAPAHRVTVTSFYIDTTEVTQEDYLALMGVNPSVSVNDKNCPVESVTWFDAVLYCNARSRRYGLDTVYRYSSVEGTPGNGCMGLDGLVITMSRNGYRLPTEAEWEYACRAHSTADYYWGGSFRSSATTDFSAIDHCAVWGRNSNMATSRVGKKWSNAFGLYDMVGNVWEWCNDWYGKDYYSSTPSTDPQGAPSGESRILRGGSWVDEAFCLRSAYRSWADPAKRIASYGFRCVRSRF
jgi:formylglycine-generating enzyme required for sulfatase activity